MASEGIVGSLEAYRTHEGHRKWGGVGAVEERGGRGRSDIIMSWPG